MNNKVYIAGPVTGHDDWEEKFKAAEEQIKNPMFFGDKCSTKVLSEIYYEYGEYKIEVVSPRTFSRPDVGWWRNMVTCLWKLLFCSNVYFLKGWNTSRGAKKEHRFAMFLGKNMFYEEDKS